MEEINKSILTEEKPKKKTGKVLIIALLLVIVAVIGVIALAPAPSDSTADPLFYTEGDGLYMKNISTPKQEPVKLLSNNWGDASIYDLTISSNKTEALFIWYEDNYSDTGDLYAYNITTPDIPPVKIAGNVWSFVKNEETGRIYCNIGSGNKLVEFSPEPQELVTEGNTEQQYTALNAERSYNKTVLAKNVGTISVSPDGSRIFYGIIGENSYYLIENGKEPVTISVDETYLSYYDTDLTYFYVHEDDSFYKIHSTGERELISENVYDINFETSDGYYLKTTKTVFIKDLFEDDMLEADSKINASSDNEAYEQKFVRDNIRSFVTDPEAYFELTDVYYYDGKESKLVLKNVISYDTTYYDAEKSPVIACIFCYALDSESIQKVSMSELWETIIKEYDSPEYAFTDALELASLTVNHLTNSSKSYFLYKGNSVSVDGYVCNKLLDTENSLLYLAIEEPSKYDTALYKLPITATDLGEAELINENVSAYEIELSPDGKLLYVVSNPDGEDYKVYYDSKLIADYVEFTDETDFENGIIFTYEYQLQSDGTPDYEGQPVRSVIRNLEAGGEIVLATEETTGEDYYEYYSSYSLFKTPAGKSLVLEENYYSDEQKVKLHLIENGKVTDLESEICYPEEFSFMNERLRSELFISFDDFELSTLY